MLLLVIFFFLLLSLWYLYFGTESLRQGVLYVSKVEYYFVPCLTTTAGLWQLAELAVSINLDWGENISQRSNLSFIVLWLLVMIAGLVYFRWAYLINVFGQEREEIMSFLQQYFVTNGVRFQTLEQGFLLLDSGDKLLVSPSLKRGKVSLSVPLIKNRQLIDTVVEQMTEAMSPNGSLRELCLNRFVNEVRWVSLMCVLLFFVEAAL